MKWVIRGLLLLILLVITIFAAGWFEYQRFLTTPLTLPDNAAYTVKQGSSLNSVSQDIVTHGWSHFDARYLTLYGRLQGKSHRIKAGEYHLAPNTTLPQFLDQMVTGKVVQFAITVIEGTTAQAFVDAVTHDPRIVKTLVSTDLSAVMTALGAATQHGEGEFLPETYYFTTGTTDVAVLRRAYKMMQEVLTEAWGNRAADLPYKTPYEALIMASIIEKETGIAEERPEIAGVFTRRLNINMLLQTDPTVIYGMGDKYQGNIRRSDLRRDTPYNTYTRKGLPPSPIALPGKAAIEAALHPKAGDTLYFVATKSEGRHAFSRTLREHNAAVRRYQLNR